MQERLWNGESTCVNDTLWGENVVTEHVGYDLERENREGKRVAHGKRLADLLDNGNKLIDNNHWSFESEYSVAYTSRSNSVKHFRTVKEKPNEIGRRIVAESHFDMKSVNEKILDKPSYFQASETEAVTETIISTGQIGDANARIECGESNHPSYNNNIVGGNHFWQTEADHNQDWYICDTCNKSFKTKKTLRSHIVQHLYTKLYKCKFCPKVVPRLHLLRDHEAIHSNEKLFECRFCKLPFHNKSRLRWHVRKLHSNSVTRICEVCGLSFNNSDNFKKHYLMHTKEKKYECKYCEKTFRRSNQRRQHQKTQHQRLTCDKCDLIFSNKGQLRKHRMVHLDRPYKCDQCDASFTQNTNLTKHKVIHSGVKPYKCHLCSTAYAHQSNLNKHLKDKHSVHSPFAVLT